MLSDRLPPHIEPNAVSRALAALAARRVEIADLTESNPTRVGLVYPPDLLAPLAEAAGLRYDPCPLGLLSARTAVAADQRRRGADVDPAHVVLTASTSEAYSWLFKLLCNPGDAVLVPQPSYPLFEHLTALEGIRAHPYALEYHGLWSIDVASMAGAPPNTRALLLVTPNNPTGSYVTPAALAEITDLCRRRSWALVVDEVFADYPLEAADPPTDIAARAGVLAFSLAGLSKSVGLPQLKLGWIIAGGPPAVRDAALQGLELVADTFLSVGTPVQLAAPRLLAEGAAVRAAIHERVRRNLSLLRAAAGRNPACDLLRTEGGWSAVIRVPSTRREEQLVIDLLEQERILVHPGYFFDFAREAYVVVSLLPAPHVFGDAVDRLLRFVSR
ncbi:MAG: pyridoxal phosphate-dependent aminotransferase [Acidobacteria bacterium]|nr:pyridoxal phosphate-dependent aminotransferase [Acidobacteriota bacterium]